MYLYQDGIYIYIYTHVVFRMVVYPLLQDDPKPGPNRTFQSMLGEITSTVRSDVVRSTVLVKRLYW